MKLEQPIWPRFLPSATVVALATVGPVGRMRRAPGTWGSVAGLLYFTIFFLRLGAGHPVWVGAFWTLLFSFFAGYFAVAICGEAEFRLGRRDPGEVVLDEFVAMPLCFLAWPLVRDVAPDWAIFISGFLLFRFFDILKPLGISRLQDLPGGWGVVADDLAAALAACASLHGIAWGLRSAGWVWA